MPANPGLTSTLSFAGVVLLGSLALPGCLRFGYRELLGGAKATDAGTSATPDAGASENSHAGDGASGAGAASGGGRNAITGGTGRGGNGSVGGESDTSGGGNPAANGGGAGAGQGGAGASAIMDAGSDPGDAMVDAGTDAGTLGCAEHPEALFCDSYEHADFAGWSYPYIEYNGAVEISTAHVRTNTYALHATTGKAHTNNAARTAWAKLGGQMSGDVWLRYYDYLPTSTVITTHFSSGVISELEPPYDGVWVMVKPDSVDIGSFVDTYPGTQAMPRDRWVCVELHVHVGTTDGYFELFLDSQPVAKSGMVNSIPATGYTSAEVGIHYAESTQGPVEVFVEDAVVSHVRVPCTVSGL